MKRILMPVALVATIAVACSQGTSHASHSTSTTRPQAIHLVSALEAAGSCGDLEGWIHDQSQTHVGPYGLDAGGGYAVPGVYNGAERSPVSTFAPLAAGTAAQAATADSAAGTGSSTGTNDQEAGVDEPDQFKSDGHRAVMTDGQRLMSIDVSGATPTLLGQVDLPMTGARLFLTGDQVLAVGQADAANTADSGGLTELVQIDLSAGPPRITAQASVDGQLVDGRLANGTIRLVVSTPEPTRVPFVTPTGSDAGAAQRAMAENRTAIAQSTAAQWIPSWTPPGGSPTQLENCASVFHPQDWSGAAMLSVLSIRDGLTDLHPVGVITDGQTIYASTAALYVATQQMQAQQWNDDGTIKDGAAAPAATSIHRFDVSGSGAAVYQGSGDVAGTVLDQYSMSEQDGDLRVVSATAPTSRFVHPVPEPIECPPTASCASPAATAGDDSTTPVPPTTTVPTTTVPTTTVPPTTTPSATVPPAAEGTLLTVLRLDGTQLTAVGRLDGLAPGEQVKSVRFVGDQAYIVTFRQVDPLFVVDLSDPTAPKLLGQVVTPGFSAYLHPIGPNLLFGVGTTIDNDNEPDGSKVSLYDTSDPTHPTEVASIPIPGQGTTLDSDPHAFTWDPTHHLAFVSTSERGDDGIEHDGLFVYRIDGQTITWVGFIDHSAHATPGGGVSAPSCPSGTFCPDIMIAQAASPANRVIVNGDQVLAASNDGVSARPVDTLKESAWVGW